MSQWVFIFYFSFLLWVGYCLGIGPISFYFWFVGQLVFLPCHCTASTVVSLNLCLLDLFCACHVLFLLLIHVTQYFCWVNFDIILGFLGPFYSFRHPQPASFLWASSGHLTLTFPWDFAKSFGLPHPNYHILYFWGLLAFASFLFTNFSLWAPPTHICLLSTYCDSHGLSTSFSGLPWAYLLSLGPFFLFHWLMDHYSCHLGLMVLSYFANSSSFTPFILLGFFLLLGLLAKMGINNQPLEHMKCSYGSYVNKKKVFSPSFLFFFSFFFFVEFFQTAGPTSFFFFLP